MEMRYGILQVTEALFYLHTTERLLHLNVCPQNVVVTKRGMWKLIGLSFTQNIGGMDAQSNVRTHTRDVHGNGIPNGTGVTGRSIPRHQTIPGVKQG